MQCYPTNATRRNHFITICQCLFSIPFFPRKVTLTDAWDGDGGCKKTQNINLKLLVSIFVPWKGTSTDAWDGGWGGQ